MITKSLNYKGRYVCTGCGCLTSLTGYCVYITCKFYRVEKV